MSRSPAALFLMSDCLEREALAAAERSRLAGQAARRPRRGCPFAGRLRWVATVLAAGSVRTKAALAARDGLA